MYKVEMYYTVKTLLESGNSQRSIAKILGIHRRTVKKIRGQLAQGIVQPRPIEKQKLLTPYFDQIKEWLENGKTAVLIHQKLTREKGLQVAYPTVVKFIRPLKTSEVFIPMLCAPGEEAQVDFGYLGRFHKDGKMVKVWCFSTVLSHSRYSYHELVLDQSVSTFIRCHIHAFEYFAGVPATVKIDNLKAGVITPSFYEPVLQRQYAEFLRHYDSTAITARIKRGQDKGKVEQGVRYVKINFLKSLDHREYHRAVMELGWWTNQVCNERVHGTTRKVPARVYESVEKSALIGLPGERYELFTAHKRKVKIYHHIVYLYNYYSVPYTLFSQELFILSNGSILKIYKDQDLVATHPICHDKGQIITKDEHKPPYKQKSSREHYLSIMESIGPNAVNFMLELEKTRPRHWYAMTKGISRLCERHDIRAIDSSCHRALSYGALSYLEVKNILEKKLYELAAEDNLHQDLGGFGHDLARYDTLTT